MRVDSGLGRRRIPGSEFEETACEPAELLELAKEPLDEIALPARSSGRCDFRLDIEGMTAAAPTFPISSRTASVSQARSPITVSSRPRPARSASACAQPVARPGVRNVVLAISLSSRPRRTLVVRPPRPARPAEVRRPGGRRRRACERAPRTNPPCAGEPGRAGRRRPPRHRPQPLEAAP